MTFSFLRPRIPIRITLALSFSLCSGCAVLSMLHTGSELPLAEPNSLPALPDRSPQFGDYRDFAVALDPDFPEWVRATDMGRLDIPVCVGLYPLRAIAERDLRMLVARHFRASVPGEQPAALLEANPQFLSVRKDGGTARIRIDLSLRLVRQDKARTILLAKKYSGERTGFWIDGTVPRALYEAMNDIVSEFLDDVLGKVPPSSFKEDGETPPPASSTPVLENLSFDPDPGPGKISGVSGRCTVSCVNVEATEAGRWARERIRVLCAEHLGIEEKRLGIRYDDARTLYDEGTKTWTFAFSAWARTRMSLQYDDSTRLGRVVVDLGLFEGTVEEAAKAAEEYIEREMGQRGEEIRFGKLTHDIERDSIVIPFKLLYL